MLNNFFKVMSKSERQAIMRFNKISLEHAHSFRTDLGSIIAENAANGLLKSGYTIKRSYAAFQDRLNQIVDDSLLLISNKTRHTGRERKRLLQHVRDQVRHQATHMNRQIDEVVFKRFDPGGDAKAAAESLAQNCLEAVLDRVDKYEDGLTAPIDERWHVRHPFLTLAIGSLLTLVIGGLVAFFSRLLN